jgi:hypothetical protein
MSDFASFSTALELVLFSPLLLFIHELGHGVVGLARTDGLVAIEVGRKPPLWRGRVGRLVLALNPIPSLSSIGGTAVTFARMPARDRLAYALGGPLAHGAASLAVTLVGLGIYSKPLIVVGLVNLLGAASNLFPYRTRSGLLTDGAVARNALRDLRSEGKRTGGGLASDAIESEVNATTARWFVLFTDSSIRVESRVRALGGAPVAVGYAPDDRGPESIALWTLALAGWCWREAEQGSPNRVRDAALDAVHRATLTGATGSSLTPLAARFLATSDVELGLGSPGTDDESRVRFLATAFLKLPANLRRPLVPTDQQSFAFRYGVALRDVERVRVAHSPT